MSVCSRSGLPARLAEARQGLQRWRRRRNRPARIPEDLWAMAVELACEHGVAPIARALRLDYYSLKKRLEAGRSPATGTPAPTFVEVLTGGSAAPAECVIELEDAGGARMRIHVKGGRAPELSALVRTFRQEASCSR